MTEERKDAVEGDSTKGMYRKRRKRTVANKKTEEKETERIE